ncbi:MAG: LamG domain-containing protein [Chthoniobacterales bacterium]
MKQKLISSALLILTACITYAIDEPPILKPDLNVEAATNYSGQQTISNAGSLGQEFIIQNGQGTISIIESDLSNKKAIKFEPETDRKDAGDGLPCIYLKKMPQDFPNGITVEMRIKLETPAFDNKTYEIFSARGSDRGPGLGIFYQPQTEYITVISGEGNTEADGATWGIVREEREKVSPGKWIHMAAVYDSEKQQFLLYLDGNLSSESQTGLELTPLDEMLTIGAYRRGYAYPFSGEMTDIAIYDYARTSEQIKNDSKL